MHLFAIFKVAAGSTCQLPNEMKLGITACLHSALCDCVKIHLCMSAPVVILPCLEPHSNVNRARYRDPDERAVGPLFCCNFDAAGCSRLP